MSVGFLNRASQVRILPGALLKSLWHPDASGGAGHGRPDDDDHRVADDDGARSEDASQEGPPEYCADDAARHDDTAD